MNDDHSAFSCAQDPASPTRRAWSYGGAARHSPESCGDQLPICSARSIVASVSCRTARRKIYYIIDGCPHDRSSAAEKKEGHGCTGPVDRGKAAPASRQTWSTVHRISPQASVVTVGDVVYEALTSGPLSSWVPDCLSSFLKEFRAPCCAVMLSSQLAILVQGRGETSRPVRQLSRRFLPDRMLDQ